MAYHDGYAGGYSGLLIPISSTADTVIVTRLRNGEPVEQYPADNIVTGLVTPRNSGSGKMMSWKILETRVPTGGVRWLPFS